MGDTRSDLSPSSRLTARAEHDRCARTLADAAAAVLVSPTQANFEQVQDALTAYTDARKVLDG